MKEYDEITLKIAERVIQRSNEIVSRRKRKALKLKQISFAVSSLCAVALIGLGIWHMTDLKSLFNNHKSETDIIEEIQQSTAITTTAITSAFKETETTKSAVSETVTSTHTTENVTALTTVQTEKQTTASDIQTQMTTISYTQTNSTTAVTSVTAESTSQTTIPQTTMTYNKTSSEVITTTKDCSVEISGMADRFSAITFTESESLSDKNIAQSFNRRLSQFNDDETFTFIRKKHLTGYRFEENEYVEFETYAEIYKVSDYTTELMIAVKFEDSDEYYCYIDSSYTSETMVDLISVLHLSAESLSSSSNSIKKEIDTEKLWNMLTTDTSLPNVKQYCYENNINLERNRWFLFDSSVITFMNGSINIDQRGYVWVLTNIMPINCYYIGEDRAKEIISCFR